MPTISITTAGDLTIDNLTIQGTVGTISANNSIIMDKTPTNETSGQTITFTGFDDTSISIPITLWTNTKYKELEKINKAYKTLINEQPIIYNLNIPLAHSLNIQTALIKDIQITESNADGALQVTLKLQEREPHIQAIQVQQQNTNQENNTPTPSPTESIINVQDKKLFIGPQPQ